MTPRPRWLWLTAELPASATTGRLVYSGGLIGALADHDVDLTVIGSGDVPAGTAARWVAVPGGLRGGVRSLLSPLPNLTFACSGEAMRERVRAALSERWDVVVIDHLQMAWVALLDELHGRDGRVVVFVTHNHEATVRRAVAREAAGLRSIVLRFDAWKAARLERVALGRADLVTSITEHDSKQFRHDAPSARHLVLAPGWSGDVPASVTPVADRPRRVGVLGSFVWHVKQENLRRFVAAADASFAAAGVELVIGGEVDAALRAEVEGFARATSFVGWVADPRAFLGACRIGLVAEPLGGGFKLKTLDYVFAGVPIAAVAGSVAGLPLVAGETMIEATDHEGLAAAVVGAIDAPEGLTEMAERALDACRSGYGWNDRAVALMGEIDAIAVRSR